MKLLKKLKEMMKGGSRTTLESIYLSQAGSIEEVERRLRQIERGQAPWQSNRY